MNVQLYAYDNGVRYELDLYPEQPIKITLSAEEITDPTQVNSTFSRQLEYQQLMLIHVTLDIGILVES